MNFEQAIQTQHGCASRFLDVDWVHTRTLDDVHWQGAVLRYALLDYPSATRCYAWMRPDRNGRDAYVIVLASASICSPRAAVVAHLAGTASAAD